MKISNKTGKETQEEFLERAGLHTEGTKRIKSSQKLHLFKPKKKEDGEGGKPCGVIERQ